MSCSISDKNEVYKKVVKELIREIKKVSPELAGKDIRAEADRVAKNLMEAVVKESNEASKFSDITSKGTILAHVSDTNFDEIQTAKEGADWLGLHVGTADVVNDYSKQMYEGKKDLTLYTIKLTKDLNPIVLKDDYISDWNADSLYDQLKHVEGLDIKNTASRSELHKKLSELGYDSVLYANTQEGKKLGRDNSLIILDKDVVKITNKKTVTQKDIKSKLTEDAVVMGSTKESEKGEWNTFTEVRENVNSSIEGMKDLMKELHDLGGGKETDEHLKYLESLFDDMDEKFFNKVNVYISKDAEKSDGIVIDENIGIKIKEGKKEFNTQMSDAEIYTHEVIHSMISYAYRSGSRKALKLKRQLEFIMDKAQKEVKWEDFLPEESIDKESEEATAKELYEYIFMGEQSPEEFVAHVLTNPVIMKVMKGVQVHDTVEESVSVWDKVRDLFSLLMQIVSGDFSLRDKGNNAYTQTYALAFSLAEINNKTLSKRNTKVSLATQLWDGFQKYNVKTAEVLGNFYSKYVESKVYKAPPPPEHPVARAKWMASMLFKMFTNNDYRKAFELILSGFGLDPRGDIQTILRDFFQEDDLSRDVDMLALLSDKIDTAKNTMVNGIVKATHAAFTRRLTDVEEEAITSVILDTDIAGIADKFDRKTLSSLLNHPEEIDRRVSRAKHQLKKADEANYKWNSSQAEGLGYFLATGKGNHIQNINAANIVRGVLTLEYRKADVKTIKLVDEIATLVALRNTPKSERAVVANLLKTERKGVENVIALHKAFQKESAKEVFGNSKVNMIKGYTKPIFDDQVSILIAPAANEKKLVKEGYVKQYDLTSAKALGDTVTKMAVYTADAFETTELYRTATRMTAIKSRGTSIRSAIYADESLDEDAKRALARKHFDAIYEQAYEDIYNVANGEVKLTDLQTGLMPVLNEEGEVVDYRYMMPKDTKKELLKQNTKMSEVLGKSYASVIDKKESYDLNSDILDMLLDDMRENYISDSTIGKNNKKYIIISAESTDPEVQDLFSRLPKLFKDNIKLLDKKELAVRADLFHNYFGYRHMSIANNKFLKMITPAIMMKVIKIAEHMWMELIKITKVDILLKMPVVIVGNLISNFMYAVLTGTSPVELVNDYLESSRNVTSYFKDHAELTDLKIAKSTGNINKLDIARIPILERRMKASSLHELVELGIYQSIVEDMDTRELESTNKLKKELDKKTKQYLPEVVRQGLDVLYLTQNTGYYKFMNEVLTKSDLIARDIENKKIKRVHEKQSKGEMALPKWFVMKDTDKIEGAKYHKTTKRLKGAELKEFMGMADIKRHAEVLNAFVNYNKPSGRVEEYLNKIGAIMFTKYFKRIQKVIATTGAKNPLNVMGMLFAEEWLGDIETIYDQSILTKSWYTFGISNGDMIPGTDPFDRIMDVINPPLVQLITDPKIL